MPNAGVSYIAGRTGVRIERDVRDHEGQQGSGPRSRAESYHSANSAQRDQRVAELERQVEKRCRALEMRGPPPQERPQQDDVSYVRVPSAPGSVRAHPYMQPMSKAPHVQVSKPTGETHIPKAKSYDNYEPPGVFGVTQLSFAYQTPDEGIW